MRFLEKLEAKLHQPKELDFYTAFRGIELLLQSGSTLQRALTELAEDQNNKQLAKGMKEVARHLAAGMSPGMAFRKEKVFPALVAATIEVGDKAGSASLAFSRLSELMYLRHNLYSKVASALLVPKISAVIMSLLILAYIKLVIPEYMKLYQENGIEIPGVISVITAAVNSIVDYWPITLLALFLVVKGVKLFCHSNRQLVDGWRLKLPIYKELHFNFLQHQFASILELMLASGLNVPQSLEQAAKAVDNSVMSKEINKVIKQVLSGHSLASALRQNNTHKVFDKLILASIKSGEMSNQMLDVLRDDCDYYAKTLNNLIEPTSSKITFMVMIPMGIAIVGMFMFTLVPMFSYIGQVSG